MMAYDDDYDEEATNKQRYRVQVTNKKDSTPKKEEEPNFDEISDILQEDDDDDIDIMAKFVEG